MEQLVIESFVIKKDEPPAKELVTNVIIHNLLIDD
jgi:hypothetical protein